jgi:hypothetical protein
MYKKCIQPGAHISRKQYGFEFPKVGHGENYSSACGSAKALQTVKCNGSESSELEWDNDCDAHLTHMKINK